MKIKIFNREICVSVACHKLDMRKKQRRNGGNMKGLWYQLKSVLRDRFCLMTFLLPS